MSSHEFRLADNSMSRTAKVTDSSMDSLGNYSNLFINFRPNYGQNCSSKTSKLSSICGSLAKSYFIVFIVLMLFIPTINCEHNSSHTLIKSKDTINYVDSRSSDEVSHQTIGSFNFSDHQISDKLSAFLLFFDAINLLSEK